MLISLINLYNIYSLKHQQFGLEWMNFFGTIFQNLTKFFQNLDYICQVLEFQVSRGFLMVLNPFLSSKSLLKHSKIPILQNENRWIPTKNDPTVQIDDVLDDSIQKHQIYYKSYDLSQICLKRTWGMLANTTLYICIPIFLPIPCKWGGLQVVILILIVHSHNLTNIIQSQQ